MENIKVVCSDIDGTLLNSERKLNLDTIEAVDLLNRRKIPFVLVSARMPKAMRPLQSELDSNSIVVAYNGAYVESEIKSDGSAESLLSFPIEIDGFLKLLHFMKESPLHFGCYYKDNWIVNQRDYWTQREENNTKISAEVKDLDYIKHYFESRNHGPHKIMIMGDFEYIEKLEDDLRHNFDEFIDIYRSKETYLEINAKAVSKSTSLDLIAEYYHCQIDNIMAFGDNYNDVDMIRKAGFGVAVENARNEAKIVAKELTDSNINNGVAKTIQKYFN